MKTIRYHINILLALASLALSLLTVSCCEVPARVKETESSVETEIDMEAVSWTAWDDIMTVIGPQPIDLITNGNPGAEDFRPLRVFHATYFTYSPLKWLDQCPEIERTDERIDKTTFALSKAFTPWIITSDLISLARMNSEHDFLDNTFRMGSINSVNYDWFSMSADMDGVKLVVVGLPDDGLIEVCIIDDYNGLDEFNDLAHYYFNLTENENAIDDYRPTRFAWTASYGPSLVDVFSYETVGYIIKIGEGGHTGVVRSYTREFVYDTGEIFELTTLELSLKYFE